MYTGHIAIALAARGLRRDLPLWLLVLATQACDWLEIMLRWGSRGLPPEVYSHAYPFVFVAASGMAAVVWLWKHTIGAALTVLMIYLSHPLADYVTGFKPLWLGGEPVGLRMIGRPTADFVIQSLICLVGATLYCRSLPLTRRHRTAVALPLLPLLTLQGMSDVARSARAHRQKTQKVTVSAVGVTRNIGSAAHSLGLHMTTAPGVVSCAALSNILVACMPSGVLVQVHSTGKLACRVGTQRRSRLIRYARRTGRSKTARPAGNGAESPADTVITSR